MTARSLPPAGRSRLALRLTAAAALGRFELQQCARCGAVQYPPREACHRCLGIQLRWTLQSGEGELISRTTLFHSNEEYFRARLPWHLGMVRLDAGPTAIAHLHGAVPDAPCRVRVITRLDKAGQAALIAVPAASGPSESTEGCLPNMADDRQLRDMTWDPKNRGILVTDASSGAGEALVRALVEAGARVVWAGYAPGLQPAGRLPRVEPIPLDVTDPESVHQAAGRIGAKVEILVNNAERAANAADLEAAQAEMDVNYFGLLRLAHEFGPAMRASGAIAWVNILSLYALSNLPSQGTFSASKAAALSLSQWLRAELQPAGVRVMNVFPGPIAAEVLARAVVTALRETVEDVYPGELAQDWLARWLENPKVLERELAKGD